MDGSERILKGGFNFEEEIKVDSLKTRLQEIATDNLLRRKHEPQIIKMKGPYPFEDIKELIREKFKQEGILPFIINTNTTLQGKITNKVNEYKNKISLVKIVEEDIGKGDNNQRVEVLYFFNERIDRRQKIIESFEKEFYIYKMISGEKEYLLFALEPLELQEYTIKGMEVEMSDMADIGNYTRVNLKIPIIFVHTAESRIIKFKSKKEFFKNVPKMTEDRLMQYLFSSEDGKYFKHPRYFERLISGFLFSGEYDSSPYPIHLLIIGQQGSGKSKVMENLHWKFKENNQITDGSCSTIKSLVPSFKSTITIQTGDLIKSNRICCVDEFLRILVRIPSEEREPQLAALNPLLEHKVRNFGSGNYSFKGQMTAKMIAVSNPVYGTSDIVRLCSKIDKSFISRLIVLYQDKEHFDMVAEADESDLQECTLKMDSETFIAIYDYLNSFKSAFDKEKVRGIFDVGLVLFGQDEEENPYIDARSVYMARYKHHIACLMDGLIKTRCLFERDESFKAKKADYENLKSIWLRIIQNMGIKFDNQILAFLVN